MSTRRLLLGDVHPWLRDPIDLLRYLLVVGAVVFAAAGDGRGAVLLGLAGAAAWLVRLPLLPRVYDLGVVLAVTLQAWGEALHCGRSSSGARTTHSARGCNSATTIRWAT
jgi:hypothetical protein